jgi:hypothetical protein
MRRQLGGLTLGLLMTAAPAAGQSSAHPIALDATIGHASFVDDAGIPHSLGGGAVRVYLTPRLAVGPELVFMHGPGSDRDLLLNGTLTYDFIRPRRGAVSPYVAAGAGLFSHSDDFGSVTYTSREGSFTGGGGVRVWITDRVYAAGDFRIGWEPHLRGAGVVGVKF